MEHVLITGGSTGIGFALARSFSKRGHTVAIHGANEDRLRTAKTQIEKEYGQTVHAFVQDLSVPGGAKLLYDQVSKAGFQVEILVNNAGMGLLAATEDIDFDADETMMRLNMIASVQLCKLYLPEMYRRGSGKILNVASVGAFQPGPYNSTYFASKSFVLSYTRAIRYEAKDRGVQICALCPGTTKTPFFEKEGIAVPPMTDTPEHVAEYAYQKLFQNKAIIIPGAMNKVSRYIPSSMKIGLVAKMKDLGET